MLQDDRATFSRLRIVRAGFVLLGLLVAAQLFRVQVLSNGFYAALASGQHDLFQRLFPERGRILTRDAKTGEEYYLAANRQLALVYADPTKVQDPKRAAVALAPILGLDEMDLRAKLSDRQYQYRPLKKQVPDEVKAQVQALGITGVGFLDEAWRYYPEGTSGAHVLGFVGTAEDGRRVGRGGIEGYFESALAGAQGAVASEKDSLGRAITIGNRRETPARDGDGVVLTLDRTIEHFVCRQLEAWVTAHQAEKGSVVILEPKTGAVVAMCNAPTFDPNAYNQVTDPAVFNNTAIYGAYEPGSVFKAITMAGALDAGKITPNTPFEDTGEVRLGPNVIRNSDLQAHGLVDMTEVLALSLNTGLVNVVSRLGAETFRRYVNDFGFGAKTGIELQAESAGDVSSLERPGDIWSATGSFGQGLTVTPLQLAAAYAAIANGGVLMRPTVVAEVRHADGTKEVTAPKAVRRVITERTAKLLTGMLVNVVERGHGKRAGVEGYWIAGKTGTAQVPKPGGGGYEADATIGSFAGFGPVEDPRFVMVVRIDRPKDVQFAESSAAPLFGEIAKFLLDYYEVPPTRSTN